MNILNLTPHNVVINGVSYEPCGQVSRVNSEEIDQGKQYIKEAGNVPIIAQKLGAIQGLPEPVEGLLLLTSRMVAAKAWEQGRRDVVCPAHLQRDESGTVTGAAALECHPEGLATQLGTFYLRDKEPGMRKFLFHWLDGSVEEGEGESVTDAFRRLGYGGGAHAALDYYKEI